MFKSKLRLSRWTLGASTILSLTLFAGRLSGLLREVQLAYSFGVSVDADIAVLLLTLPDLLINLLLSGGLSAVLVPRFRSLSSDQADALFCRALLTATSAFALIAILVLSWPKLIFILLAPGLQNRINLPDSASLIFLVSALPFTAASGVATAYLNASHRFFVAGCGTLIFNLGVMISLGVGHLCNKPILGLCIGIGIGAFIRMVSQLISLPGTIWKNKIENNISKIRFYRAFMTATLTSSLMLFVPVAIRALGSILGVGFISSFNYALKLVELPVGILLGSISTVALSRLSEHQAAGDLIGARALAVYDIRRSLLMALAVMLVGGWFASPSVRIVLARGAMDVMSLQRVIELMQIALIGLPAVAMIGIATASLNAALRPGKVCIATGLCLAFLPLLTVPGLLAASDRLLMMSMVCFQFLLASILSCFAGLKPFGQGGWMNRNFIFSIQALLIICGAIFAVDVLCTRAFGDIPDLFRLTLAGLGLFTAITLPAMINSTEKVVV